MNQRDHTTSNSFLSAAMNAFGIRRDLIFSAILVVALVCFEVFNYSTTLVSLKDILGDLGVIGVSWAIILSIAFCGIDFAGIARLFVNQPDDDSHELWYLFAAWLLAATMNALLTWWGVSIALLNQKPASHVIVDPKLLSNGVPIVIAIMVWVTRVLLIGTFTFTRKSATSNESHSLVETNQNGPYTNRMTQRGNPLQARASATYRKPSGSKLQATNPLDQPEPEYIQNPSFAPAKPAYRTLSASHRSSTSRSTGKL